MLVENVTVTRPDIRPGDRLLVKVYKPLPAEARARVARAVERWAGVRVEVLVIDGLSMDLEVERG